MLIFVKYFFFLSIYSIYYHFLFFYFFFCLWLLEWAAAISYVSSILTFIPENYLHAGRFPQGQNKSYTMKKQKCPVSSLSGGLTA